ncbi:membrane protein insertase YidC [Auraticoccus sp. F435]|uniref:Membrane protein insertase YidC n=1 Tax=Auraticoccus cholistanensis TaxID=2656650 RepID=A0A6A9UT73_9ACTN|nr:membrane protein insertase YidC [Auraticoccus cholistanensis]MVA74935.1 membrane protein insertase YidC [Auraticoccus cholistanensis]
MVPLLTPLSVWSAIGDFFNMLMSPLHWAVSGLLVLFHALWSPLLGADSGWTWTLSIVCLTVVVRILTIPLFVKQIKSSRNMQLVQPKMRELQKKYGHDRERLGQETMKLYREEGVNPMASCLPLLLQMPIFFALFQVLNGAARGTIVSGASWLERDPILVPSLRDSTIFGARISDTFLGSDLWEVKVITVVLILLMTATMFFTQLQLMRKNMPKEALEGPFAQQQKIMLYIFPVVFAVGGVNFPVGVLIYWLTSNLWTMGQQFYIIRRNPAPGTEAYELWEQRQRAKGKDPETLAAKQADKAREDKGLPAQAATASTGVQRQTVQRQQPRRQTRAQRGGKTRS